MTLIELQQILARGKDSQYQFKQNITNADSIKAEIVAMANAVGGKIIIGVNDNGEITGLSSKDIRRLNQLISNANCAGLARKLPIQTVVSCRPIHCGGSL